MPEAEKPQFFKVDDDEFKPNTRTYHSRLRLMDDWQVQTAFKGCKYLEDGVRELTPVLAFALDVNGIVWASVRAHSLIVEKDPVFTWDEIDLQICNLWIGIVPAIIETEPSLIRERMKQMGLDGTCTVVADSAIMLDSTSE